MLTTDKPTKVANSDKFFFKRVKAKDSNDRSVAYQKLSIVKKLANTKFPVYLALSKVNKQCYAIKIFPYKNDKPHNYFENEIRFSFLKHPNIVNFLHYESERETTQKGDLMRVSYILMEYAPYGDFFSFVTKCRELIDDKLVRTYFRQLIDGIEYLHENGIAHLDLKPENLLIDADFNLKITDFDLSYMCGDTKILSKGTKFYRGPELFRRSLKVSFASDIYSAGVILFILKSGGMYPHAEDDGIDHGNFVDLLATNNNEFWVKHCEVQGKEASFYESSFKELFNGMMECNPHDRLTIRQIKESEWYNEPIYSESELRERMEMLLKC